MAEMITTGTWIVNESRQEAFVDAWAAFAGWASSMEGAGELRLGRDGDDPNRFVSFGAWTSSEHVHAWKANPDFRELMARVLQHVDEFHPIELDVVASANDGHSAVSFPVSSK